MNLTQFLNVFDFDQFTEGADGLSRINHPNLVFDKLRELCEAAGMTYSWDITHLAVHPLDKRTIVAGALKVWYVEAPHDYVQVAGSAIGQTTQNDVAGVTTSAFMNACLRGLGMAEAIYATEREPKATQAPPAPPEAPPQAPPAYAPRPPAPNYGPRPGGNRPPYPNTAQRRTDGRVPVTSGKYAGQFYDQIPIEELQRWANFADPNQKAVAELNRRMAAAGAPSTDYNDPGYSETPF